MGEDLEAAAEPTRAEDGSHNGQGLPAKTIRVSRCSGTMESGVIQRQEAQIVQSCLTLDDSLP